MGCNCGKNKNKSATQKRLSEAFEKSQKKDIEVRPDSIPQIQTKTFRDDEKTVIRVSNVRKPAETSPETPKKPGFGEKVKNFTKAMASRAVKGKASPEIVSLRVISCHGNNEIPPCPYRGDSVVREGFHFCTACGCGDRPQTWLNHPTEDDAYTKLHYPWVSCPVRNPGFGDYKPYDLETNDDKEGKKEGMDRKKIIEAYLNASGIEIPDHPAPQPKKGE